MKFLTMALCLLTAAGTPLRAEKPSTKPVTVPFELLKSRHMAIQIKVNGKGPYRVIFDTGAPIMLLNTRVARESGIVGKNAKPMMFNPFGSMGQVKIKTLEIGGLKAEELPAIVMDHPTVDMISRFLGPIEGIVGFPFFARYKMTIDYQAKELTFVPSGFTPPDALQTLIKTVMGLTNDQPPRPRVLAPAAQWGMILDKGPADEEGVTIQEVLPGSAAATAGLQAGDRLLSLHGRWTDSLADTYQAASAVKAGMAVTVVIQRAGEEIELTVKPRSGI